MSKNRSEKCVTVKPVETDEELRIANGFVAEMGGGDGVAMRNWLAAHGAAYPGYQREHTRMVLSGGVVIGALRINSETLHIGDACLRVGGLGWITISPEHKKAGVLDSLVLDALTYLRKHAYHFAMLFKTPKSGVSRLPNPYGQLGFTTTISEYAIYVDTVEASSLETSYDTRPGKPGDIDLISNLHNKGETLRTCTLVRTRGHLTNKWQSLKDKLYVILDKNAKVIAYFIACPESDSLAIYEIGITDRSLCDDVLAVCANMAADLFLGRICFHIAPDHVFSHYLKSHSATHETGIRKDFCGMMSLVDVGETLESMLPEWERLLTVSPAGSLRTEFTLLVPNDSDENSTAFRIRANRGIIDVATTPGKNKVSLTSGELVTLLTGYEHLDDILDKHRRLLTNESRMLMSALFPKRSPYVWLFDRF